MSLDNSAIRVEGLGKRYQIGREQRRHETLRDLLTDGLRRLGRRRAQDAGEATIWALRDVSFAIGRGEVVGIIGRNGAGKSTLLKILARITEPTEGHAAIHGRVASLLEVGTGFHPELSGRENVFLNGAILGMKRAEIARQFDEIVAFAEVAKFVDTPVKHYSSGMYVRLAFAVAAHLEPEILLVDEVLAVGDAEFQRKCLGKIGAVARAGRTVVFVSHNMAAVEQLCARSLLIGAGRLAQQGPTAAIISAYLSDATQAESGDIDVAAHPARLAGSRPIIQRVRLYSAQGALSTQYYPDEGMIVELALASAQPIRQPRVAVAIEDSFGRRITTAATFFQDAPLADIEGPCMIRCTLPRLGLGSGRYLISVSVASKYEGQLDGLHNVAWFEVAWRNNYGNGESYQPVYGPVLTPSVWERVA